jgi:hypothetical protein
MAVIGNIPYFQTNPFIDDINMWRMLIFIDGDVNINTPGVSKVEMLIFIDGELI